MASKPCFLQEMDNFTVLENSTIYVQGLAPFVINGFPDEIPPNAVNNFHHFDLPMSSESASSFAGNAREESRIPSAGNPPFSLENTGGLGGRKRRREDPQRENEGKTREVVHVRAKRGQATDNHSLAERIRREKINQRLKCLQDLVPGCYKTMGMAVMLDVIIGYIQSLQNQIEFLSLKLSAASRYYDFNSSSDVDPTETLQESNMECPSLQGANGYEMQEMERVAAGEEGYGGLSSVHSTLPF